MCNMKTDSPQIRPLDICTLQSSFIIKRKYVYFQAFRSFVARCIFIAAVVPLTLKLCKVSPRYTSRCLYCISATTTNVAPFLPFAEHGGRQHQATKKVLVTFDRPCFVKRSYAFFYYWHPSHAIRSFVQFSFMSGGVSACLSSDKQSPNKRQIITVQKVVLMISGKLFFAYTELP